MPRRSTTRVAARCRLEADGYRIRALTFGPTGLVAYVEQRAMTAFAPLPLACGYWWAIADFQPDPILDPTLVLETGRGRDPGDASVD